MKNEIIISGYTGVSLTISLEVLKVEFISEKYIFASLGIIIYFMRFKDYLLKEKLKIKLLNKLNVNKRISWEEYFIQKIIRGKNQNFDFKCENHSNIIHACCTNCKVNICEICIKQLLS